MSTQVQRIVHGGDLVVETLAAAGVEVVFGIPGGHSTPVYDALSRQTQIRHVLGRHEQGLVYMADGYSRATGKIGVVVTTSGPAVANAAGAMGGVTTDGSSVLVIASAPRSDLIGRNRGGLHDLREAIDVVRPLSRAVARCTRTEDIPGVIEGLMAKLTAGRPGAAFCEIPADLYAAKVTRTAPPHTSGQAAKQRFDKAAIDRRRACADDLERAAELLSAAERPFLIAGTGALLSGAGEGILRLSELTGAVVTTTALARGLIPPDHPAHAFKDGGFWKPLDSVIADADVVLAVGTMFRQEDTADWRMKPGGKLIHIDIDPEEIGRSYPAYLGITADAKEAVAGILQCLRRSRPADRSWRERAKRAERSHLEARRRQNPLGMEALDVLRSALPRDAVIAADRCSLGYWIWRCYPTETPRSFQYPMGYGGLGGALPQAIGARIGAPKRPVVCVIGDGGIQFTLGELAVAAQEGVRFPIVLCNNNRFGAIHASMKRSYGHAALGCTLWNPDYRLIAKAYGLEYSRADSLKALGDALVKMLANDCLGMIELTVDLADPLPDVDLLQGD